MTRHSISPRKLLPLISFSVLLIATFALQERAMSYLGLNLLFNLTIPIALATIGQLLIIMVNDIDLSVGAFVSLVACIVSTLLVQHPWLGWLALAGLVLAYAALGALIHRFEGNRKIAASESGETVPSLP